MVGIASRSASSLTSVSGAGQVAIPLAIAGLIIFNTMMGSIAERKREIHVYTSLGLAPLHVGALFLAEALTYGLIGTVFGYVIGQGIGTALLKFGWLGGITLNYSGTSAILTMGLILLIVLLSALVPARLASKLAAPSIERSWKVPLPRDGRIVADLPFTINKTAADKHYVTVSRWSTVLLFLLSIIVTSQLETVASAWELLLALGSGTGLVLFTEVRCLGPAPPPGPLGLPTRLARRARSLSQRPSGRLSVRGSASNAAEPGCWVQNRCGGSRSTPDPRGWSC